MKSPQKTSIKYKVGSYPYFNVMFSITTALAMIGLFSLFAIYAAELTHQIRSNIELTVNLSQSLAESERDSIRAAIAAKPYIDQNEEGSRIKFLSKEEAAQKMIAANGEDFVTFLGVNPLRDAFTINIVRDYHNNEQLKEIKQDLEKIPGVFEVIYTPILIEEINQNLKLVGGIVGFLVLILLITVVILINNAIKLALFSQRFLIRSMQLVGATAGFIKKPFLVRALLHGAISGLIALGLVAVLGLAIEHTIPEIQGLKNLGYTLVLYACLVVGGALIGGLSAFFAVSHYLNKPLDQLY